MTWSTSHSNRSDLARVATQAVRDRGLEPEFSPAAMRQLDGISGPAGAGDDGPALRDLRKLLWWAIDNDDSRDLDQISACDVLEGGAVRVVVAIADVDALVVRDRLIDEHVRHNTTSVSTGARWRDAVPGAGSRS